MNRGEAIIRLRTGRTRSTAIEPKATPAYSHRQPLQASVRLNQNSSGPPSLGAVVNAPTIEAQCTLRLIDNLVDEGNRQVQPDRGGVRHVDGAGRF